MATVAAGGNNVYLLLQRANSGEYLWISNYPAGTETLRVFETLRVLTAVQPTTPYTGRATVAAGRNNVYRLLPRANSGEYLWIKKKNTRRQRDPKGFNSRSSNYSVPRQATVAAGGNNVYLLLPRANSGEYLWISNYPAGTETLRVFETLRVLTAVHPTTPFPGMPAVYESASLLMKPLDPISHLAQMFHLHKIRRQFRRQIPVLVRPLQPAGHIRGVTAQFQHRQYIRPHRIADH